MIPIDAVKPKAGRRLQRLRNLDADARAVLLVDRYDDDWSSSGGCVSTATPSRARRPPSSSSGSRRRSPPTPKGTVTSVIVLTPSGVTGWAGGARRPSHPLAARPPAGARRQYGPPHAARRVRHQLGFDLRPRRHDRGGSARGPAGLRLDLGRRARRGAEPTGATVADGAGGSDPRPAGVPRLRGRRHRAAAARHRDLILPQRNPLVLAKQAAPLDVLSAGRLLLGIGAGYLDPEMTAIGVPMADRGTRTDDHLAAMRALWTEPGPVGPPRRLRRLLRRRRSPVTGDARRSSRRGRRPLPRRLPPGRHLGSRLGRLRSHAGGGGACLEGLRQAADQVERPAVLGDLEISVTPRRRLDAEALDALAVSSGCTASWSTLPATRLPLTSRAACGPPPTSSSAADPTGFGRCLASWAWARAGDVRAVGGAPAPRGSAPAGGPMRGLAPGHVGRGRPVVDDADAAVGA